MSVLAEFTAPPEDFVLADTLAAAPEMRIEIKRVIAGKSTVTPYFWASNGDFEQFEDALHADEMVQDVITLEESENDSMESRTEDRLYRVTWTMDCPNIVTAISDVKATVMEAISEGGEWELKTLFPDHDSLSDFHQKCVSRGFDVEPTKVYRPDNVDGNGAYDLTGEQQEALETAYEWGYFAVPREHTLTEIADALDLSRNALSTRIRRGQRNLLRNTLIHEE